MNKDQMIEWAVQFLNTYLNVPVLNEKQEAALIEGIVKMLVGFTEDEQ